jgi:hypothetical protein
MPEGTDDPSRTALIDYLARVLSGSSRLEWDAIQPYVPDWTDHTDSDPGITMLQLFSWLTEALLYRNAAEPPAAFRHLGGDPEPLRELLSALVNEVDGIQGTLDQLYDSAFFETSAGKTHMSESGFPGVFVEETPFRATPIPGVSTSLHSGPRERLVTDSDRPSGRFPGRIEAPDLNAQGNEVAIESIELSDLTDPDPDGEPGED